MVPGDLWRKLPAWLQIDQTENFGGGGSWGTVVLKTRRKHTHTAFPRSWLEKHCHEDKMHLHLWGLDGSGGTNQPEFKSRQLFAYASNWRGLSRLLFISPHDWVSVTEFHWENRCLMLHLLSWRPRKKMSPCLCSYRMNIPVLFSGVH